MDKKKNLHQFQPGQSILKKRREELGYTQQQIADIASMDIRLYQRYESGERKISRASFRIGVAIADVLKLDVHELVYNPTAAEYLREEKEMERIKGETEE